jgi:hypothetical protein
MAAYDYIDQSIVATCLIAPKDIDSFYNPTTQGHTGFAWDGQKYLNGVLVSGPVFASWYTEGTSAYRGELLTFPQSGLVLLSKVACTILDSSTLDLSLWMQFLMENTYALADDFNAALNGWRPSGLAYADGILSIIYAPDTGNQLGAYNSTNNIGSNLIVSMDFAQDRVYLDVALNPTISGGGTTPPTYSMTQHQSFPHTSGSSFNGVKDTPINLFGFASSTDAFTNWVVSQTDAKLFITFYDGAMVQLEFVDLSTVTLTTTVTPPTGTAYYTINTVDAVSGGIYQVNFTKNADAITYATSGTYFDTSFSATTENVYPLGEASPGETVTVTGSPSSNLNLIFYDSAYGILSSTAVSNGTFTAPAGTVFWSILLQGASVSGTYSAIYTFS